MRLYKYVGPATIRERSRGASGLVVRSPSDIRSWAVGRERLPDDTVPATFVVDSEGRLRIADRRSEHVACASGGDVQSAGEMFFQIAGTDVQLVAVTNQSTGYCPEADSWPAVAAALDAAGFSHPGRFTTEFVFRRCEHCGQRNVVRERDFQCGVCGGALPGEWNFDTNGS